ncbi:MAG: glucose 1-dehydrogenase [Prosthecobacter sp.]|jgi:2-keto-3-deoxy-L-fuconate dehydrogenase|uniref:SDR family NAD(P)-dependent oxidoreductase n=1 Tax=Prosthecobacter sp. TaxID=1965333 RepID=UPI0019F193E3|nr:glucose 1-dehydrogenase [Prosthecobacter sp.]MBE2286801.1 glucose 1-dehydrogenase [Prosthecobacter sp.]
MFSLANKTVIITGAGSGIGQAIAILFAKQGAHVEVFDLQQESAQETVDQIKAAGGSGNATACDVGDYAAVKALFDAVAAKHGKIDILVNNAGIAHIGTVLTTTEEDMDRLHRVNIKGVHACAQAALAHMVMRKNGVILNMCSIAAQLGLADRFAYSMTKGAVLMMTYSIAKDFIKDGIRCNCIAPARVHTPFVDGYLAKTYPGREAEMFQKLSEAQPIGRMAKPDEIASLALYLCSDEASFATGTNYTLDGGAVNLR